MAEKFSTFSDARSGVNPFTLQPYRPGLPAAAAGSVVAVLKVPFIALCWLGLAAVSLVSSAVSYSGASHRETIFCCSGDTRQNHFILLSQVPLLCSRVLRLTLERLLSRCLLVLFGFYSTPEVVVNKASVRVR